MRALYIYRYIYKSSSADCWRRRKRRRRRRSCRGVCV